MKFQQAGDREKEQSVAVTPRISKDPIFRKILFPQEVQVRLRGSRSKQCNAFFAGQESGELLANLDRSLSSIF
jgi:hypothetical protein